MSFSVITKISELKNHLNEPLYRNSFFIMLTTPSSAGFGFIFWLAAAKLYSKEDIGIATALISSMTLPILISRFGLDQSLVRFFPERDKSKIFSTACFITTFFALLFGIAFISGIDIFSPELKIIKKYAFLYFLFIIPSSILSLTGVSFVALRRAEYNFLQSLLVGSRIIFLVLLVSFGAFGIFISVGMSFILALIISALFLLRFGIKVTGIDMEFLKESFHFSAGNYFSGLLLALPAQILPILVLSVLGAEETAHYYIAFTMSSLLFIIPTAFSTSLFVEGSHGEALKKNALKSLFAVFSLLVPGVIILYFLGGFLLGLIGKTYAAGGLELLRLMALSSFFVAINSIYFSIKKIQKDVKSLIFLSALIFALLIGLSYVFMPRFGIHGVGYAWLLAYGLSSLIVGALVKRERWI